MYESYIKVIEKEEVSFDYLVIKIGDRELVWSSDSTGRTPGRLLLRTTDSAMGGIQRNIWLRTSIVECNGHEKLSAPVPVEVDIYYREQHA